MNNKNLKKHYDKWHTDAYHTSNLENSDPKRRKCFNLILDYLDKNNKIEKGKKILDIACGKGLFLNAAKEKGLEIFGLDISDVAINKAKAIVKESNFVVGDAEEMPYQDEEFDYVTCFGSLEHFAHPEKGVRELSRALKRNGVAMVYVPNLMFVGHVYMTYKYGVMPSEGG